MKRELAKFFMQYASINCAFVVKDRPEKHVKQESDLDPILKEIFSVDERTGMPHGDIAYFLSKNANPQVKAFIEGAFFQPRSVDNNYDPAKISDDLIVECTRRSDESVADYAARLDSIRLKAIDDYKALKSQIKSD